MVPSSNQNRFSLRLRLSIGRGNTCFILGDSISHAVAGSDGDWDDLLTN